MRCKSCNATLKPSEIIWYPKEDRHEDLCYKCRSAMYQEFHAMGWKIPDHVKEVSDA